MNADELHDPGLQNSDERHRPWRGHRTTQATAYVITRDHGICWLCNHPGANSTDHVQPKSVRPELTWAETNWRAAHLARAGRPKGCTTPDCTCPGNSGRKTQPPNQPPSRTW